jgi:hypothetical protein
MTKQVVSPAEGNNHDLYYGTWTWEIPEGRDLASIAESNS